MIAASTFSSRAITLAVIAVVSSAPAYATIQCASYASPVPGSIIVATPEMRMAPVRAGACLSLDAQAFLDRVRAEAAMATGASPTQDPRMAGRFYMTQNGKRMTADDFDAWMKAKGIRVATGKTPPPPPPPATTTEDKQPR